MARHAAATMRASILYSHALSESRHPFFIAASRHRCRLDTTMPALHLEKERRQPSEDL
jgi:hypothetical protein